MVRVVWGVILTFLIIPIFVLMYGKRYCSWICGCGGLAETFGDRWRHLAPKGKPSIGWEWMGTVVLIFAAAVTLIMLLKDVTGLIRTADWGVYLYGILCDVWLVGILPVTLYSFMGGEGMVPLLVSPGQDDAVPVQAVYEDRYQSILNCRQ